MAELLRDDVTPVPRSVTENPAQRLVVALDRHYDLGILASDKAYTVRVQLLKALRGNGCKILARDVLFAAFRKELYGALGVTNAADFALRAEELRKATAREEARAKKEEEARIAKLLRGRTPQPGAPIKDVKRKTRKQRTTEKEALRRELLEREEPLPVAVPRPDATVTVYLDQLRLLEDPANGIVLLQLEKENSQGAICVYNNGIRVAAGVVSPEIMKTLQVIQGNLYEAAFQLLHPMIPSVVVTPVAERHLTAVLHCKEIRPMSTQSVVPSTKKFAPPTSAVKSKANGKEKKPAAKKVAKGENPAQRLVVALDRHYDLGILASDKAYTAKKVAKGEGPGTRKFAPPTSAVKSKANGKEKPAKGEGPGRAPRYADDATIKATYKEQPYREGTARATLLDKAAKAGTVGKYVKTAGEPTGGSAMSYLNLFVKEGHLSVK